MISSPRNDADYNQIDLGEYGRKRLDEQVPVEDALVVSHIDYVARDTRKDGAAMLLGLAIFAPLVIMVLINWMI